MASKEADRFPLRIFVDCGVYAVLLLSLHGMPFDDLHQVALNLASLITLILYTKSCAQSRWNYTQS